MNWLQTAEEILDVVSFEETLFEQDMTEANALAILLQNGFMDFPEWYKHREGYERQSFEETEEKND